MKVLPIKIMSKSPNAFHQSKQKFQSILNTAVAENPTAVVRAYYSDDWYPGKWLDDACRNSRSEEIDRQMDALARHFAQTYNEAYRRSSGYYQDPKNYPDPEEW